MNLFDWTNELNLLIVQKGFPNAGTLSDIRIMTDFSETQNTITATIPAINMDRAVL